MAHDKNSCSNSACTQLNPCMFPILSDSSHGDKDFKSIRIGYLPCRGKDKRKDGCDIYSIAIIAWSIVLQRFTELGSVHFGIHGLSLDPADRSENAQHGHICKTSLDATSSIKSLFENGAYTVELASPACHVHRNTGILFIDGGDNMEDDLAAGAQSACRDHCYDVAIVVREYGNSLEVFLHYQASFMADVYARCLAGGVNHTIHWLVSNPEKTVREADMLCPENIQQITHWSSHPVPESTDDLLDVVINRHGVLNSTATAVCSWDGDLTYAQLNDFSSRLAAHLQSFEIGPGSMVPICMEKSIWTIVAVQGVLNTGAAIVLLDGSQPLKRLQDIITQVNAQVILASPMHANNLSCVAATVVRLSGNDIKHLHQAEPAPSSRSPEDIAYILFTSGSTGNPKGCMMSHRGLAGFRACSEPLQVRANSRTLHFASYGVHSTLLEIFCTLSVGATLCIPSDHERMNDLGGAINRMGATWAVLTPSTLRLLNTRALHTLQTVITGAEPIPKNPFELFAGNFELRISYGMTECAGLLSSQLKGTMDEKNVGKPFYGNFWLTEPEDHNRLSPIGTVGEIVVEWPYIAHGYLGDSEKTAANFIESPVWLPHFRPDTNRRTRMYKTGDLGQYASDGTIRYIGRKDTQVKLHGLRIELAEVEGHLRQSFPSAEVTVADVIAGADGSFAPSLVAFIWFNPPKGEENTAASTGFPLFGASDTQFRRDALAASSKMRASLPSHMVPTVYIPLVHLPLTMSRKVDRRALKAQAMLLGREQVLMYSNGESDEQQPRNCMERTLHRLIAQILDLDPERLGTHDSFYKIGGDSVSAIQLVRLCRAEGVDLTVQDIYEHDTVSDLASYLSRNRDGY